MSDRRCDIEDVFKLAVKSLEDQRRAREEQDRANEDFKKAFERSARATEEFRVAVEDLTKGLLCLATIVERFLDCRCQK